MRAYHALNDERANKTLTRAGKRQDQLLKAMNLIATILLQDQVDIREADANDPAALACLAAYYQILIDKIPGVTPQMVTLPLADPEKYRPPHGAFLIAWSDDLPIGCVSVRPLAPTVGEVKRLWVDPAARGQGLARRLMTAIEDKARALGMTRLHLDTNSALHEAVTSLPRHRLGRYHPLHHLPRRLLVRQGPLTAPDWGGTHPSKRDIRTARHGFARQKPPDPHPRLPFARFPARGKPNSSMLRGYHGILPICLSHGRRFQDLSGRQEML